VVAWECMGEEFDLDEKERPGFNWQMWVEEHRWYLLLGLLGLFLLGLGVREYKKSGQISWFTNNENRVEILSTDDVAEDQKKIVVDVGGAVNKPGVYEFDYNARIDDSIVTAGGLTENADQEWIEKVLNRAERLRDGQKVYVLNMDEARKSALNPYEGQVAGVDNIGTVSINTANQSELEALWGVGPVTAEAIISGRPYGSVQELLDKKIFKQNVWERNKDKLSL